MLDTGKVLEKWTWSDAGFMDVQTTPSLERGI